MSELQPRVLDFVAGPVLSLSENAFVPCIILFAAKLSPEGARKNNKKMEKAAGNCFNALENGNLPKSLEALLV